MNRDDENDQFQKKKNWTIGKQKQCIILCILELIKTCSRDFTAIRAIWFERNRWKQAVLRRNLAKKKKKQCIILCTLDFIKTCSHVAINVAIFIISKSDGFRYFHYNCIGLIYTLIRPILYIAPQTYFHFSFLVSAYDSI